MRMLHEAFGQKCNSAAIWLAVFSLLTGALLAQTPAVRITLKIDDSQRTTIPGTRSPMAIPKTDAGQVPSGMQLHGITMVFRRSALQEARLQALIAAQQDLASPLYHKWLSPDEFAARFGVATSDIAKVESWLEEEGFSVDGVSRSRNRVAFS